MLHTAQNVVSCGCNKLKHCLLVSGMTDESVVSPKPPGDYVKQSSILGTSPQYAITHSGYLADDCQLVADARVRQLRSADTQTLVVSRTRSSFGDRTFAATGAQVGNSLPPNLRLCGLSYGQFRRLLKTFLFG